MDDTLKVDDGEQSASNSGGTNQRQADDFKERRCVRHCLCCEMRERVRCPPRRGGHAFSLTVLRRAPLVLVDVEYVVAVQVRQK